MSKAVEESGAPVPGERGIVSSVPLGLGRKDAPSPLASVGRALWQARSEPAATLDLLVNGVCEGCNLGPRGLADDAASGVHVCALRLHGLQAHLAEPVVPADLIDADRLRRRPVATREALGRVVQPFRIRRGERGFQALPWDRVWAELGPALRGLRPEESAALLRPAGGCLETHFAASALWMGPERVHLARAAGVEAAQRALVERVGDDAAWCSLLDMGEADLIVLLGVDPGRSHPDLLRLVDRARASGTRVLAIAADRLPSSERAWTLGSVRSALFGSVLIDDLVLVRPGQDGALLQAVLARLDRAGAVDGAGLEGSVDGLSGHLAALRGRDPAELASSCGVDQDRIDWVSLLVRRARRVVSVVGRGVCHDPAAARRALAALTHLHLALGLFGRPGCGMLPLFEDESERGARELGLQGHQESLAEVLRAAPHRLLLTIGDEPLGALARPAPLLEAMEGLPLLIHLTGRVQELHLTPLADETWILPIQSRYTQEGGSLVATVERRVRYSPEIGGLPVGDARPAWWLLEELDRLARGAPRGVGDEPGIEALRRRLPERQPAWRGVEALGAGADQLQRDGRLLFERGFPGMPEGRARVIDPSA